MKVGKHIGMILILLLAGCSGADESTSPPPLVKTIVVGGEGSRMQRSFPGRVMAGQRADLAFQIAGTLSELPVKDGQRITQGQVLAKLDARDFQSRYDAAKSTLETATLNFERGKKLVASGTIAQVHFDELRTKYEIAKSEEGIAAKALADTMMTAPFAGMIARVYVDNFQEVQAKEKIMTVQDIGDIDIIIDVPERDIINRPRIQEGLPEGPRKLTDGYVVFDGIPNQQFDVMVKEYATEADPTTQTYQVRLSMKAPTNISLLPGMTANLIMKQQAGTGNMNIPAKAVAVDAQGQFYVWVVSDDLKISKVPVQVGEMMGDNIVIRSGLAAGQRVVVAGLPYLEEGMSVRLFQNAY